MRCITNKRRGKRIEKAISHLVTGKCPTINNNEAVQLKFTLIRESLTGVILVQP